MTSDQVERQMERERAVEISVASILPRRNRVEPDYAIDWCDYFIGPAGKKGRQLKDPSNWNCQLLPELIRLSARIQQETTCRRIRISGLARLSVWFAFGFVFPDVAGYTIEVDQYGQYWSTDAKPSPDFRLLITSENGEPSGEVVDGIGPTVAAGISISGSLEGDVRDYLATNPEPVASLLLLRPERNLGRDCLRHAGDVVALADRVKTALRSFVKAWQATRLLLFYCGPLSGACFIGYRLNAACQSIQIMEDQQPGYAPSFLLR